MWRARRVLGAVGLLLAVGWGAGCRQAASTSDEGAGLAAKARATTIKLPRQKLVRTIELPGRVEAFETVPLYAKVAGYVSRIPVDLGDSIRGPQEKMPGTLLCEIDVPELREQLAEKKAGIAQAAAEVAQAEVGVQVAIAALASAEAKVVEVQAAVSRETALHARWQSEYQRVSQLASSGAVTRKVAEETRAELDAAEAGRQEVLARVASAQAARQEAAAQLDKSRADVAAARARQAVAEAEHRHSETTLEYAQLRAPFDGIVVARNVHPGHLVQPGTGGSQPPLLMIVRSDPVRVFVDVPETDAPLVSPGTQVEVRIPAVPGQSYVGQVTRSSWSLHPTSRTLTAEIDIPNAELKWRPGMYVQVVVTVAEREQALSLPKTALVVHDKQPACLIVESSGTVARRQLALGIQAGTEWEVLEGLSGDERVIGVNPGAFQVGQVVDVAGP